MCPPLSCCHQPGHRAGPVPTLLYYLQRLLLASTENEVLSERQRRQLPARLQALWHQVFSPIRHRRGQCPAFLVEGLLPALLERACCCAAVRERVPLSEALYRGFRGTRRWARQAVRLRRQAPANTRTGSR